MWTQIKCLWLWSLFHQSAHRWWFQSEGHYFKIHFHWISHLHWLREKFFKMTHWSICKLQKSSLTNDSMFPKIRFTSISMKGWMTKEGFLLMELFCTGTLFRSIRRGPDFRYCNILTTFKDEKFIFYDRINNTKSEGTVYYGLSDSRNRKRIYPLSDLLPLFQQNDVKLTSKGVENKKLHENETSSSREQPSNKSSVHRQMDSFGSDKIHSNTSRYLIHYSHL